MLPVYYPITIYIFSLPFPIWFHVLLVPHIVLPMSVHGPPMTFPSGHKCSPCPYLCVFPDGEFLTFGLLECIDWNPEPAVTNRDGLPEFVSGYSRNGYWGQWQQPTACWVRPLALATCMPFSSLFSSAVEMGPFPLQLQHSLGVCLLLPKENLASPGHTAWKAHPKKNWAKTQRHRILLEQDQG